MTSELNYYGQVNEEYRQLKHDLDCFNADRNEVELIRSKYYRKIDEALRLGQYSGMGDLQKAQDYINAAKEELEIRKKIHTIPTLLNGIYWKINDLHLDDLIEQLQKFANSAPVNDGSLTIPEEERLEKLREMRIILDEIKSKVEHLLFKCGYLPKQPHDANESPAKK